MMRYGSHAAGELAGLCVPPTTPVMTGTSADGGMGGTGTGAMMDGGTDGPVNPGEAGGTTRGVGGSLDSGPLESGEASIGADTTTSHSSTGHNSTSHEEGGAGSDSAESTDTGGAEPVCREILVDDFDDGLFDLQWHMPWVDFGTTIEEIDSVVRFSLVEATMPGDDAGLISSQSFDLRHSRVRIELGDTPPIGSDLQLYLKLQSVVGACDIEVFLTGSFIFALGQSNPYGANLNWLQLRLDGVMAHAERSTDGVNWTPAAIPIPLVCDLSNAEILLFGGAGVKSNDIGLSTSVDFIEACITSEA